MTDKQKVKIDAIIARAGRGPVQSYIRYFYPEAEIDHLTKMQAQKVITGFGRKLPKPVMGTFMRSVLG